MSIRLSPPTPRSTNRLISSASASTPTYDTPKVLHSYGGAYTGNYTNEKFLHWDFAAPTEKDLAAVTQYFDVGVTPGDSKSLTHSLSTVLIGKDGKVIAWYPNNEWEPADVVATIRKNVA